MMKDDGMMGRDTMDVKKGTHCTFAGREAHCIFAGKGCEALCVLCVHTRLKKKIALAWKNVKDTIQQRRQWTQVIVL
jgi:hypothetical protein